MYVIIPEKTIISCAKEVSDDPNNAFIYILSIHNEFKNAGLNPLIIYDTNAGEVYVTTKERMTNKLN
jgi:hypothetical protein